MARSKRHYRATSNHVHRLAFDNEGRNVIPDSIKLVAGRTGQEYNVRKNRKGAFWQDRYHATAVESNYYLRQCITYIDIHYKWADSVMQTDNSGKENKWTQSIAVGSKSFVEKMITHGKI